jgi:hypothetical protein
MIIRTEAPEYGCHNRAPFKKEWVGYGIDGETGNLVKASYPFRMASDCQYTLTELGQADKRCEGCCWRFSSASS